VNNFIIECPNNVFEYLKCPQRYKRDFSGHRKPKDIELL